MFSLRNIIIGLIGISALAAGIMFAVPLPSVERARVDIGAASVSAEVVRTPIQKMKGLGERNGLPEFGAMLFVMRQGESGSIWMKDMRFPIDIFWIRDGKVVDLQEDAAAPPPGAPDAQLAVYRPDAPADLILETNAGFAKKYGIVIGSPVKVFYKDGSTSAAGQETTNAAVAANDYSDGAVRERPLDGENLHIEAVKAEKEAYKTYLIRYMSDGLEISGTMNVPSGVPPKEGFSAVIMNHGVARPEDYTSGSGLEEEEDFLARHGYVTIHPDYRGYPHSSENPNAQFDFYTGYTRDVLNLIDAMHKPSQTRQKRPFSDIDVRRMGMLGKGMGGAIVARAMVQTTAVRGFVLLSPIHTNTEDFNNISAPVQIHHGIYISEAPVEFSRKIHTALQQAQKRSELFLYDNPDPQIPLQRILQFFDHYVKK